MIINYYGKAFVKIQLGDFVVAFNPPAKNSDYKSTRFGSDLALVSLNDSDYNGVDLVTYANKTPFVVSGPGEYEIGGIFIQGFPSQGKDGKINTIYILTLDGIRVCHLGIISKTEIDPSAIEQIGIVDVLFVPIGGNGVLSSKDASKISASFEPKIIVPIMHNGDKKDEDALKLFLKEMGGGDEEIVDKLTIKRKDLDNKEGEVVIIKSA